MLEFGSWRLAVGGSKLEIGSWRLEDEDWMLKFGD
jgi:hypothetical protein